jgi:hypothetical protein
VTTATITKKWKCISMTPPEKWTRMAEQVIRPALDAMVRSSRPNLGQLASNAAAATVLTSLSTCSGCPMVAMP